MDGYCEHIGAGNPVNGGIFVTHDTLNVAVGLIRLGPAIDGSQVLISMSTQGGSQDIIFDEKNGGRHFNAGTYSLQIGQYAPGSLLTASGQGLILATHLNSLSSNSDNAGICTMGTGGKCSLVTFATQWASIPACTATWTGGGTLNGKIQAVATTSGLTIQSTVTTDTAVVAYNCQGNPN